MDNLEIKYWREKREKWEEKQKFYEKKIKDHVFSNNDDDGMLNSYFAHLAIVDSAIRTCDWSIELIESMEEIST